MLFIVIDFILSFIENYIVISLLELFFEKRKHIKFITALIFTLFSNFININAYPAIYSSLFLLLFLYIYTYFNLTGNSQKKIIAPLLVYINLFIINGTTIIILSLFLNDFSAYLYAYTIGNLLATFFTKIILFIEYMYIKKYINNDFNISKKTWIPCVILSLASMVFPQIILTQYLNGTIQNIYIIGLTFLCFIIIHIMIYLIFVSSKHDYMKILEQEILLETKTHEQKMIDFIELRINEMNRINHDFNNHKNILKDMIQNKNIDDVENYMNELFPASHYFIKTNNAVLNYIINEKIELAMKKNIDIKCFVQGDFSNTISIVDLNIVIGNLLDNAIQASEDVNDKHINLHMFQDKYKLIIKVTNFHSHNLQDFHQQHFTSKVDKKKHGFGLSNIKLICEKYDGENVIEKTSTTFTHTCIFLIPQNQNTK